MDDSSTEIMDSVTELLESLGYELGEFETRGRGNIDLEWMRGV